MSLVLDERPAHVPFAAACRALGVSRSTMHGRARRVALDASAAATGTGPGRSAPRTCRKSSAQPRALGAERRAYVLGVLNAERFRDQPPVEIFHALLEEGEHLCSISTMHRILREQRQNGDRRDRREPQRHAVPRLEATAPNTVWTWDCTKAATLHGGLVLSITVVLDLYSRYVLAWMVSDRENGMLATQLMSEAAARYRVAPGQLTIHQDRGSPMIAHRYIDQMSELGVTLSHSRPRVSNDNAFSESQFATQKGQPDWPGRFASLAHARQWHDDYFRWYNHEHHHAGLAGFTPEQVFTGRHHELALVKQRALDAAYKANPERFVAGPPALKMPPTKVVINPFTPEELAATPIPQVNFATHPRVRAKSTVSSD